MSLSFAMISNDPVRTACALAPFRASLTLEQGAPHGWGLAYYQAGQPLLRKQPQTFNGVLDFTAEVANLRTNHILGHARNATTGRQSTENTHPFRYRGWTFCGTGTLDRFDQVKDDVLRSVPDFIRRNIRGQTDAEHLFHLFLSFLNDTGKLDDPRIPSEVAARAMGATFHYVDRLLGDRGGHPTDGVYLASNGVFVVGIRLGMPLRVKRHSGYACPGASGKIVPVPGLEAVVLLGAAQPRDPGWEEVPDHAIITVNSDLNIQIVDLP